jgi:hypothetical protein
MYVLKLFKNLNEISGKADNFIDDTKDFVGSVKSSLKPAIVAKIIMKSLSKISNNKK